MCVQQDYMTIKYQLLDLFNEYNKTSNTAEDICENKIEFLKMIKQMEKEIVEYIAKGNELKIQEEQETNLLLKQELSKELVAMRKTCADMKIEVLKKVAMYNVKFVNKCKDCLQTTLKI